jgi:hypothetical protein
MKLIRRYNFAKAQNPQKGERLKFKLRQATVRQYAVTQNYQINYVKLN